MSQPESNPVTDALLGLAVGDALGVPVEFRSRQSLDAEPVTGMRAYGSHQQPAGTWSDDSSLTFCLAEMLCGPYDLQNLANRFVSWQDHGYWTADGKVFDIGIATAEALGRLRQGGTPERAGGADEWSNGNGSLMRITPLAFYTKDMSIEERFQHVRQVSSLTHRHIRSILGCFLYTEYVRALLCGDDKWAALRHLRGEVALFLQGQPDCHARELRHYHRILLNTPEEDVRPIEEQGRGSVASSGYVVSTLEASLWCILTTDTYADAVLTAVNLGEDTDTTGAVTGGLAGILYGREAMPGDWLNTLARRQDIEELGYRLSQSILTSQAPKNSAHEHP